MRVFSDVAVKRLPQFYRDDYPAIVEFLQAYYQWMETRFGQDYDFKSIRDIDDTLEQYLKFFKQTLADGLPDNTAADMRTVLKNIRDLFASKGTDKSIKFLFKAIFNDDVEVFYPRTQIFAASDSTWIRNRTIRVAASGDITDLKGRTGTWSGGSMFIENAYQLGPVFVLNVSNIEGTFSGTSLTVSGKEYSVVDQVVSVRCTSTGSYKAVNDTVQLSNGVIVSVNSVKRGSVRTLTIVNGGTGYLVGDLVTFGDYGPYGKTQGTGARAVVSSVSGGAITGVRLLDGGSAYDLPPGVFVQSTAGSNAVIRASGDFGQIQGLSVISSGNDSITSGWTETIGGNDFTVSLGKVCEHLGSFSEVYGATSSTTSNIQDEHFYQYFSYVIRSGVNLDQYRDVLRLLVHPAGMKQFSSFRFSTLTKLSDAGIFNRLVADIHSVVSAEPSSRTAWTDMILYAYIKTSSVSRSRIDVDYKFKYFNESTIINRFKDERILDWSDVPGNEFRYTSTNIRPDAIVRVMNIYAITPGGIGTEVIGDANIG